MSKHTPGPWKVDAIYTTDKPKRILYRISQGGLPEGSPEANAHLLAAAPELLEQLKGLVCFYEHVRPKISLKDGYPDPSGIIENLDHIIPHIKAVVAKAEGRETEAAEAKCDGDYLALQKTLWPKEIK